MGFFRLLAVTVFLAAASLATAAQLTVFAAASLSDALSEIGPLFTTATGHSVRFNFGASGALARQIKEGAPADVFFSADELRADELEKAGLLLAGTRRTLLANQLVVIVAAESPAPVASVADLGRPAIRRIAIGEPATVLAGTYARAYLQKVKLWPSLGDKFIPVENVRAVLAAVESGNVDAGFVYKTDAFTSKKTAIAVAIPLAEGPRITYPVAVVKDTRHADAARAFIAFLAGDVAQKAFARSGFLAPQ